MPPNPETSSASRQHHGRGTVSGSGLGILHSVGCRALSRRSGYLTATWGRACPILAYAYLGGSLDGTTPVQGCAVDVSGTQSELRSKMH